MEFFSIVEKECCSVKLEAKSKEEALRGLAALAKRSVKLDGCSEEEVFEALRERERQGSTGFGNGVALPHIRLSGLSDFIVLIAVCPKGVEFDALDKKKVRLFFLIIAPADKMSEHVRVLAAVSRALASGRMQPELLAAHSEGVLYETFLKHVQHTVQNGSARREMKVLFVILYFDEFLYHVLEYFIQEGIDGATIMESSGMGEYISSLPLFASFIGFMNERRNHSKTIMALIPADREQEIMEGIEQITGDLDKKDGAMVITLSASFHKGSMRMM